MKNITEFFFFWAISKLSPCQVCQGDRKFTLRVTKKTGCMSFLHWFTVPPAITVRIKLIIQRLSEKPQNGLTSKTPSQVYKKKLFTVCAKCHAQLITENHSTKNTPAAALSLKVIMFCLQMDLCGLLRKRYPGDWWPLWWLEYGSCWSCQQKPETRKGTFLWN